MFDWRFCAFGVSCLAIHYSRCVLGGRLLLGGAVCATVVVDSSIPTHPPLPPPSFIFHPRPFSPLGSLLTHPVLCAFPHQAVSEHANEGSFTLPSGLTNTPRLCGVKVLHGRRQDSNHERVRGSGPRAGCFCFCFCFFFWKMPNEIHRKPDKFGIKIRPMIQRCILCDEIVSLVIELSPLPVVVPAAV